MKQNFSKIIVDNFLNAKYLIKNNCPKEARDCVLKMADCAREIYNLQTAYYSRAKTRAFIYKWLNVAITLREKGITDLVKIEFGLLEPKVMDDSAQKHGADNDSNIKVEQPMFEKSETIISPNFDSDYDYQTEDDLLNDMLDAQDEQTSGVNKVNADDLVQHVSASSSQGWCADMFELYSPSVCTISSYCNGSVYAGTGFLISSKGYILTNHHVIFNEERDEFCENIYLKFFRSKKEFELRIIDADEENDVALCQFDIAELDIDNKPIKLISDYRTLKQGADVLLIGNAFSDGLAPVLGIVKQLQDHKGDLVVSANTNNGDSGSPLLNRRGEVIGINKSSTDSVIIGKIEIEAHGLANATHSEKIRELLENWTTQHNIEL